MSIYILSGFTDDEGVPRNVWSKNWTSTTVPVSIANKICVLLCRSNRVRLSRIRVLVILIVWTWMVRQLSPTKGTMCSTARCIIQMANSKVMNIPGNSFWTSVVSYFHERPTSATRNQCSIFADCTSLHTGKSTASSCTTLSADLDAAATWAERWGMLLSSPQSKHLSIGKKARQSPPVSIKGVLIPQVCTDKHLGLVLNESLTWSDHISSVYAACARMIGILRCLDETIRSPAMKKIYTAVTRPRMEYAGAVWSGGPTACLQLLQDSYAKRHSLSLPPLEKRFESLVLFYRVRANLAPTY